MRIIVDADACPSLDSIADIAFKYNIKCHLFCDYNHNLDIDNAEIHYISEGYQMVDMAISNFIKTNDILITSDYGLACIGLSKNSLVISPNGMVYNNKNIDILLEQRYLNILNRKQNIKTKNFKKRTKETNKIFLNNLKQLIISNKKEREN